VTSSFSIIRLFYVVCDVYINVRIHPISPYYYYYTHRHMFFPLITSLRWCHRYEACPESAFRYRATHALMTTQTKTEGNDVMRFHTNPSLEAECELSKRIDCCIYYMLSHPKILNFSHVIIYVFRTIFSQQWLFPYFLKWFFQPIQGLGLLFRSVIIFHRR
jgi:hypothetical protein